MHFAGFNNEWLLFFELQVLVSVSCFMHCIICTGTLYVHKADAQNNVHRIVYMPRWRHLTHEYLIMKTGSGYDFICKSKNERLVNKKATMIYTNYVKDYDSLGASTRHMFLWHYALLLAFNLSTAQ